MRRFTETNKWDDPWFRSLPGVHKLAFLYVIDRCNNAGFWEVDMDGMQFHTKLEAKHVEGALKGLSRGIEEKDGWVWVKNFLKHQKNDTLNEANPAHRQIIALVKDQVERFPAVKSFLPKGASKGLQSPIGKGIGKGKELVKEKEEAAEAIYAEYPRKVAHKPAIKAIIKALDTHDVDFLIERTKAYAAAVNGSDRDFLPHPATWFNAERFNDDPKEWASSSKSGPNGQKPKAYNHAGMHEDLQIPMLSITKPKQPSSTP